MLVKFAVLGLLIVFNVLFGFVSCAKLPNPNLTLNNDQSVLLEVSTILSGMVYPKGEILNLRVYKDGKVEFDDYPPNPYEVNSSRQRQRLSSQIDTKDVQQLEQIINQMDFPSMKKMYSPTRLHNDSQMTKTIKINYNDEEKVIQIEENDVVLELGEKSPYPETLIHLLKTVDALNKKLRKLE